MSNAWKEIVTVVVSLTLSLCIAGSIGLATGSSLAGWLLFGAVMGLGYGLEAGLLRSYDLSSGKGWLELVVDWTWSLPNTVFGFIVGNLIYVWFGNPSRADSENQAWIVFRARGTGAFGNQVLQTLGTVNLGGPGQHKRMHLLQARLFGPLYLPLVAFSYGVTALLQLVWTGTLGWVLRLLGVRRTAFLEPPARSAVHGFFGWIYYATPMELWAYTQGNP